MTRIGFKDIIQVLKGAGIVGRHLVLQSSPELLHKFERAQFHATELVKAVSELAVDLYDKENTKGSASDNSNSTSQNKSPATYTIENPDGTGESTSTVSIKPDRPIPNVNESLTIPRDSNVNFPPIENLSPTEGYLNSNNSAEAVNSDKINFPIEDFKDLSSSYDSEQKIMRERSVPSTQISRMWGFGSLAIRMAAGAAVDNISNLVSGGSATSQSSLSNDNAERLAEALCRMRGAALKLGQMLSIQDDGMLPPALAKALERVRQNADYMPKYQLEKQLNSQLGSEWRSLFQEFHMIPIAAASIGQVHRGVLLDGTAVAIKIQYPGVAESIHSDLMNLKRLVTMTNLLPPGLFVDEIIRVASVELTAECNYHQEAESQIRYRQLVMEDSLLSRYANVPEVYSELSTERVLTTRLIAGIPIDKALQYPQATRNAIARTMLYKTLKELFHWRFMQTDPNWGNFLYDGKSRVINLIDFGAARNYPKPFVDGYIELVWSAANRDEQKLLQVSKQLGFLTGDETPEMIAAHVEAGMVVGEPFLLDAPFNFADSRMTQRIGQYGGIFVKYRLTPPPTEAYSLHRKLAGAFLLCIRLKATIKCRDLLVDAYNSYPFER